jgi:shikimate kinase
MGCGKTAVAKIVAAELNREIVDLDERITEREGRTPGEIISKDGEPAFRSLETNVLNDVLRHAFAGIVALGGGCWIELRNRMLLGEHKAVTIWIDTPFEVCWQRIEVAEEIRPLAPTKAEARALFERRRRIYKLADIRIENLNDESLEALASRTKAAIELFKTH